MIDPELHKHIYVVIMAGGKGERFWPLSTESEPKPFIKVMGDRTLIQMTAERATGISSVDRIFVVLGKNHLDVAKKQLETLPDEITLTQDHQVEIHYTQQQQPQILHVEYLLNATGRHSLLPSLQLQNLEPHFQDNQNLPIASHHINLPIHH